ncbi:protein RRP5 homolog [Monodelphis domestica]|uniref:protein RRP5 homolog n=1 Tax=Monodelphis domestica TaxID=13616 RepID=UPI0024E19DCB|nr:protein RRP5 homolog [Monodelphis domestica]
MASQEDSFPRGGSKKKAHPVKAPQQPIEHDNLFDIPTEEGSRKRKRNPEQAAKNKRSKTEKKEPSKSEAEQSGILSIEVLSEGMRLLGCVKEVNNLELVISLPNDLWGYVQATNICDAYTKKLNEQVDREEPLEDLAPLSKLFQPGMLVRCAVSSLKSTSKKNKSIKLSLNPKDVNGVLSPAALKPGMLLTGTVDSVEDHGYLVDIGVGGTKAFLPWQKEQEYVKQKNKGTKLQVGQYLNCLIEEVKGNGGSVRLSTIQSEVSAAIATEEQNWTLDNLLPGLVVKAQVQKVTPYGLSLSFLSSFTGLVDFMHLDSKKTGHYFQTQMVRACILSVHPRTKSVRLTLHSSFLQAGRPITRLCHHLIGAVLNDVPVQSFYTKAGATFRLKDGSLAYARIRHLSQTEKSFKPEKFKPGNLHRCRVIDFSPMDDLALLSLKTSIIEAPFLRYHDIQPGQIVKGKVFTLRSYGMIVKVTEQIKGLVPTLHLADVQIRNPQKKYRVQDEVKCRVLMCDPENKKLLMTLKKTLVESSLPALTNYKEAKPDLQTHGFISSIKDCGCIVKFYNDVRGLVPQRELGAQPISAPEEVFYVGQVVKVTVLKSEPEQERMLLSFRLSNDKEMESTAQSQKKAMVKTGQLVDVKVKKKTEKGLEVSILPDDISALLPTTHLSDNVTNSQLLCYWLQAGDILHKVLCLSHSDGHIVLCRKPALISAVESGQDPKVFSEFQPGMLLTGFVKSIKAYGIFVQFPSGLSGLAPKSALSDKFVTTISDHFVEGQTVVAKVTNVDEEKQRMLLSLRLSDVSQEDTTASSLTLLSQCLEELQGVRSLMSSRDSVLTQTLAEMTPGLLVDLVVQDMSSDGSLVFSNGSVPGLVLRASKYHQGGKAVDPGQRTKAVILHVDTQKSEVHVSLRQELVNRKVKQLKKDTEHRAVIEHLEKTFAIASLVETGQLIAFPVASHLNDTFRFDSEKLQVGQGVSVIIKSTKPCDIGLFLAVESSVKKRTPALPSVAPESAGQDPGVVSELLEKPTLPIGEMVTGTVKSIKATHVIVTLENGLTGYIHASQILDDVSHGTHPTTTLKVGNPVTARVIGQRTWLTHKSLPISHPSSTQTVSELSIRPSELEKNISSDPSTQSSSPTEKLKQYFPGQTVVCFMRKFNVIKKWLEVEITSDIRGRIPQLLTSLSFKVLKHPEKKFKIGQALSAIVVGPESPKAFLNLSLIGPFKLEEGEVALGRVVKVIPKEGLEVIFPFGRIGKASIFDLSDSYLEEPLEGFHPEKIVRCCVLSNKDRILTLSLRQSRTNPKMKSKIEDPEVTSMKDIKEGQLLRGYVEAIKKQGIFFRISPTLVGRVKYQHVTTYLPFDRALYQTYLPEGKLLSAKVLRVNRKQNLLYLSFLPKDTGKPDVFPESLGLPPRDQERELLSNQPKKKRKLEQEEEDHGASETKKKQQLKEKKEKKQLMKEKKEKQKQLMKEEKEKQKQLMKEKKKKQKQLVKEKEKQCQTKEEMHQAKQKQEDQSQPHREPGAKQKQELQTPSVRPGEKAENKGKRKVPEVEREQEIVSKKKKQSHPLEEDDSGVEVNYKEEKEKRFKQSKKKQTKPTEVPRLQLSSGFAWDVSLDTLAPAMPPREDSSDSEDEEASQATLKKSKKGKELEKQEAEKELSRIEAALMDPNWKPETADDFDRLVLSSPNSSILWLQYMAFHLHATEIEKARAVAERALKSISFREEQEKLNVWVALMNLENMYGSKETLTKVFERAVQYCEPLKVYFQLADIYTKSEKYQAAEELYSRMLKRFRQEKTVWIRYGAFLLQRGQADANHRLLQRSFNCLPQKEHVDVISKFAQLEFQLGDAERAKAMFETTLSSYPKRTDVWSVYIDMIIKYGSQKEARDIFERVVHLSLAPKRMKFFFKRYLDYEKQHGTAETVQAVKEKALAYVEATGTLAES